MTDTAPRLDLRPDHWAIVSDILRRLLPDRKVLAFGSRATWTAKDYSDLDLAILGDEPLSLHEASALAERFEDSDLPFKVDLVDWARLDESFQDILRRDGVAVQIPARSSEADEASLDSVRDWPMVTVEELSEKVAMGPFGSSIKVSTFVPDGVPIISGQHLHGVRVDDSTGFNFITDEHATRLANANVRRGDVIFTHRGNIGQVAYVPEGSRFDRYIVSQSQFYLRCDRSQAIPEFVALYFASPEGQHQLLANTSQVGVPSIAQPVTYLRTLQVPLPPLSEQRAIAHILGTLDDKIELNRRMNATLEAMARALFRSWFVDFDPVRAKMTGRDTGLPKEVSDLFPDRLVKSEMGEIPEGWPLVPLPELMEVNPSRSLRNGDVAPYLDMANMPTLGHAPDSVVRRPFGSGTRFANGDTLVARITPCLENGKTAYVDFLRDDEIGWGSTEYIVLKPRRPLPSEFAYLLARTGRFREFAIQNMSGTSGRQRVSASALSGFSMPSPPETIGVEFGRAAQLLLGRARAVVDEREVLANCRDTLLPKLISGEIRVGDAEKVVGANA